MGIILEAKEKILNTDNISYYCHKSAFGDLFFLFNRAFAKIGSRTNKGSETLQKLIIFSQTPTHNNANMGNKQENQKQYLETCKKGQTNAGEHGVGLHIRYMS